MKLDIQKLFIDFMHESEFVRRLRPATLSGYQNTFGTLLKVLPDTTLGSLSSSHMVKFFKILEERERIVGKGIRKVGIKKSTIGTYRSKLNSYFLWLKNRGYIKVNPFENIKYPSVVYEDKKFLKKEAIEKIFSAIHLHHNGNILILKRNLIMFYFLLLCGLRREELLHLQIRDIDLERKIVIVRAENSKSQRTRYLPLHSELLVRLPDYLHERRNYMTQYLFVSSNHDGRLTYDGMRHIVKKLIDASGVRFHLHQFRHTFAMNYLKQNDNIFKLKELLGHKDIKMTAMYLRQMPTDELRDGIENLSIDNLVL